MVYSCIFKFSYVNDMDLPPCFFGSRVILIVFPSNQIDEPKNLMNYTIPSKTLADNTESPLKNKCLPGIHIFSQLTTLNQLRRLELELHANSMKLRKHYAIILRKWRKKEELHSFTVFWPFFFYFLSKRTTFLYVAKLLFYWLTLFTGMVPGLKIWLGK